MKSLLIGCIGMFLVGAIVGELIAYTIVAQIKAKKHISTTEDVLIHIRSMFLFGLLLLGLFIAFAGPLP